jgi:uncharacterized protein YjbJ (UPF0337 family)
MGLEDKARHTSETMRGKAKNAVGRAKGDKDMEAEGKVEEMLGHLKQAGEQVKDAIHSVTEERKKGEDRT